MEGIINQGLRHDGRKRKELRQVKVEFDVLRNFDSSVILSQGNTKVLCYIKGPKQQKTETSSQVRCYFSQAHFSSIGERRKISKGDKRLSEFESVAKDVFQQMIVLNDIPNSEIDINIVVLQDDGSIECVALNAITLALIRAGVPMHDFLVACSSGFADNESIIDLTHNEAVSYQVIAEYKLAMVPRTNQIAFVTYDDLGGNKLSVDLLNEITTAAMEGARDLHRIFRDILLNY